MAWDFTTYEYYLSGISLSTTVVGEALFIRGGNIMVSMIANSTGLSGTLQPKVSLDKNTWHTCPFTDGFGVQGYQMQIMNITGAFERVMYISVPARWFRLEWVPTAGTGTMFVKVGTKTGGGSAS